MLTINDFKNPTKHPFGMLKGTHHACEKEGFMWWFLKQCRKAKDLAAEVTTQNNEDGMVAIGLLSKCKKKNTYRLTNKAKGLLFSHYAKATA